jgi:hypothetical protein
MKAIVIVIVLIAIAFSQNAEGIDGEWHGSIVPGMWKSDIPISWYYFSKGNYKIDTTAAGYHPLEQIIPLSRIVDGYYDEAGTFSLTAAFGLQYVNFKSNTGYMLKNRLGVLISKRRLFLYDGDGVFFEPDENASWLGYSPEVVEVRSSSSLKEKQIAYDGKSFIQTPGCKLQPWVEGVSGDGAGEWIEFDIRSKRGWATTELLVANGYISFVNPSLFSKNNRIRGYRITSSTFPGLVEGELKDSQELQSIVLPTSLTGNIVTVRLTILSVYKGDKWDDTCLSLVYPLPPIPPSQYGPND